jgi:periplasmic glucans biosynthesis protein
MSVTVSQRTSGGREVSALRGTRRRVWLGRAAHLLAIAALSARVVAAEDNFSFETVRHRAKELASKPHVAAPRDAPEWLQKLSYDEHRIIEFDQTRTLWRSEKLPFQLQFFHPGWYFNQSIRLHEIRNGRPKPIPFRREYFRYHQLKVGEVPATLGFAGFKLMFPVNGPERPGDELGAFLGASYFRLLCKGAVYGLSARGLALNTGDTTPEEFPVFTEFWIERPGPRAKEITLYALLDSDSVAGAYRFIIVPGADTVVNVKATLYARKAVKAFGVAPLTSMFWRGENTNARTDDFRPEVHDSDGLLVHNGAGEWIWRPLQNVTAVRTAAFADQDPHGFGLLQRDRNFDHFQDLEATYHARPSAWVEPIGTISRISRRLTTRARAPGSNRSGSGVAVRSGSSKFRPAMSSTTTSWRFGRRRSRPRPVSQSKSSIGFTGSWIRSDRRRDSSTRRDRENHSRKSPTCIVSSSISMARSCGRW